jgi:hypothetical protein
MASHAACMLELRDIQVGEAVTQLTVTDVLLPQLLMAWFFE